MNTIIYTFLRHAGLAAVLSLLLVSTVHAADCATPLCNPLKFDTISEFVAGALKVMVMIALPIVALFLVISGFKFISAQGNPGKLGEAKMNFVYVVLGALLILGAWVLANLIGGTVDQLTP